MPAPLEDRVTNLETLMAVVTMQQAELKAKTGSSTDLAALGATVERNHTAVIEEIGSLRGEIEDRFGQIDGRFAQVDDRLAQVDVRLAGLRAEIDSRFARVDDRFADVGSKLDRILVALGVVDQDGG
ncbi:hypothetical protein ACQP2U_08530 [Nocardia sp. CA-084685]|uniref:hypothetical protein n=1 Tax=Nocardia sp. CA-084685 TaxID=3239970 RepID=UPI003D96A09C